MSNNMSSRLGFKSYKCDTFEAVVAYHNVLNTGTEIINSLKFALKNEDVKLTEIILSMYDFRENLVCDVFVIYPSYWALQYYFKYSTPPVSYLIREYLKSPVLQEYAIITIELSGITSCDVGLYDFAINNDCVEAAMIIKEHYLG